MSFSKALMLWRSLEGGYTVDAGGETCCGIRKDLYLERNPGAVWVPSEPDHAAYLFKYYWQPFHCGDLPEPADSIFFQWIGNSEVAAVQALQIIVGELPDGALGPITIAGMDAYGSKDMADYLVRMQAMHYVTLHPKGDRDFVGLQNRVKKVEAAWNADLI